jgi:hypothetical protein
MKRILIIKYFLFSVDKCLSRKAVHNLIEKFSQGRLKVADNIRPGAEVTEITVETRFDALVNRWDKNINVGGGYIEKYMFFPASNITCFTFCIHL